MGTTADVRLLADYVDKLDEIIGGTMHVFISYRVATDAALARALHKELSSLTVGTTSHRLRVYLDVVKLVDGQR